jgi:hypothetical protein
MTQEMDGDWDRRGSMGSIMPKENPAQMKLAGFF